MPTIKKSYYVGTSPFVRAALDFIGSNKTQWNNFEPPRQCMERRRSKQPAPEQLVEQWRRDAIALFEAGLAEKGCLSKPSDGQPSFQIEYRRVPSLGVSPRLTIGFWSLDDYMKRVAYWAALHKERRSIGAGLRKVKKGDAPRA